MQNREVAGPRCVRELPKGVVPRGPEQRAGAIHEEDGNALLQGGVALAGPGGQHASAAAAALGRPPQPPNLHVVCQATSAEPVPSLPQDRRPQSFPAPDLLAAHRRPPRGASALPYWRFGL